MTLTNLELGLGVPTAILSFIIVLMTCKQQILFNSRRKERHQSYVKRHPIPHICFSILSTSFLASFDIIDGPWLKETQKSSEIVSFILQVLTSFSSLWGMLCLFYRIYMAPAVNKSHQSLYAPIRQGAM